MKKTRAVLWMLILAGAALPHGAQAEEARQIAITLNDTLRIQPERIQAKAGETVDFVVHNAGKLRHEFVIGEPREVDEHAKAMQSMGGMSMEGKEQKKEPGLGRVDVAPGKTEHLRYRFARAGTLAYACLYPGHREAGMKGVAVVR